jgi:hypothetical protein
MPTIARAPVRSNRYDILGLNAHFSATPCWLQMTPRVRSGEIGTVTDHRFANTLVLSMGCHSGYNIVDRT